MIRNTIEYLLISTILAIVSGCAKEEHCNEVVHSIQVPTFTTEQEKIIDKYQNVISSELSRPEKYFIYSIDTFPNATYRFILFPLNALQAYYQTGNCGGVMVLDADIWFIIDTSGTILESNIHRDLVDTSTIKNEKR